MVCDPRVPAPGDRYGPARSARSLGACHVRGPDARAAAQLAERLAAITPVGLEHVFVADSGSVSIEVAIKMALQFWHAQGCPQRCRLLAVRGGHGDTFGAMAVCDPIGGMHPLFTRVLPAHLFSPAPPDGFDSPLHEAWVSSRLRTSPAPNPSKKSRASLPSAACCPT